MDKKKLLRHFDIILPLILCLVALFSTFDPEHRSIGESREGYHARYDFYERAIQSADDGMYFFLPCTNVLYKSNCIQSDTGKNYMPLEAEWEDPGVTLIALSLHFFKKAILKLETSNEFLYQSGNLILLFAFLFILFSNTIMRYLSRVEVLTIFFLLLVFFLPLQFSWIHSFFLGYSVGERDQPVMLSLSMLGRYPKTLVILLMIIICLQLKDLCKKENFKNFAFVIIIFSTLSGTLGFVRGDVVITSYIYLLILCIVFIYYRIKKQISNFWLSLKLSLLIFIPGILLIFAFSALPDFIFFFRDMYYGNTSLKSPSGHPTWHILILGLGYVQNNIGLAWDDGKGYLVVQKYFPNLSFDDLSPFKYGTHGYELLCKELYFKLIQENPLLVAKNYFAKASVVLLRHAELILMILIFLGILKRFQPKFNFIGFIAIFLSFGVSFIIPVLTYPSQHYYSDLLSGMYFITGFLIFYIARAVLIKQGDDQINA